MRRAAAAQRILAIATTPDRAAAVVGDLLEEEPARGRRWFWVTVARTTIAFAWLDVVRFVTGRHPVFLAAADSMGEIMDVWRFVWSRKRLVVIPVVLFTAIASLVAYSRPVRYRSEALIRVVPQRIPESFVRSTVTTRVEDRLVSIMNSVLTRTQLEQIILELNLYQKERRNGAIMQDIVERMRTVDIQTHVERGDTFRVSYVGSDPRVVLAVTEKLATAFIVENVRNRGNLAEGTSQFLEASLEELRRNVDGLAEKMEQARAEKRVPKRSEVLEYKEYQSLFRARLATLQEARTAANLERRQIGEQFQMIEPARIPEIPEGPDRLSMSLSGAGAGFGLGLLLLMASSMRRPTPPAVAVSGD